jgi:hypothetical protein
VHTDGFVDLLVEFLAALNGVRGEPAAHAFVLEVGVEAVGEGWVFGGIADEAGVVGRVIRRCGLTAGSPAIEPPSE